MHESGDDSRSLSAVDPEAPMASFVSEKTSERHRLVAETHRHHFDVHQHALLRSSAIAH